MYYVLGSRELVAPASAGAPSPPAQACTSLSHSRVLHAASFAVQFCVRPPRAPPDAETKSDRGHLTCAGRLTGGQLPTPNRRHDGGAWGTV